VSGELVVCADEESVPRVVVCDGDAGATGRMDGILFVRAVTCK
jgi:hypothetical protein